MFHRQLLINDKKFAVDDIEDIVDMCNTDEYVNAAINRMLANIAVNDTTLIYDGYDMRATMAYVWKTYWMTGYRATFHWFFRFGVVMYKIKRVKVPVHPDDYVLCTPDYLDELIVTAPKKKGAQRKNEEVISESESSLSSSESESDSSSESESDSDSDAETSSSSSSSSSSDSESEKEERRRPKRKAKKDNKKTKGKRKAAKGEDDEDDVDIRWLSKEEQEEVNKRATTNHGRSKTKENDDEDWKKDPALRQKTWTFDYPEPVHYGMIRDLAYRMDENGDGQLIVVDQQGNERKDIFVYVNHQPEYYRMKFNSICNALLSHYRKMRNREMILNNVVAQASLPWTVLEHVNQGDTGVLMDMRMREAQEDNEEGEDVMNRRGMNDVRQKFQTAHVYNAVVHQNVLPNRSDLMLELPYGVKTSGTLPEAKYALDPAQEEEAWARAISSITCIPFEAVYPVAGKNGKLTMGEEQQSVMLDNLRLHAMDMSRCACYQWIQIHPEDDIAKVVCHTSVNSKVGINETLLLADRNIIGPIAAIEHILGHCHLDKTKIYKEKVRLMRQHEMVARDRRINHMYESDETKEKRAKKRAKKNKGNDKKKKKAGGAGKEKEEEAPTRPKKKKKKPDTTTKPKAAEGPRKRKEEYDEEEKEEYRRKAQSPKKGKEPKAKRAKADKEDD